MRGKWKVDQQPRWTPIRGSCSENGMETGAHRGDGGREGRLTSVDLTADLMGPMRAETIALAILGMSIVSSKKQMEN